MRRTHQAATIGAMLALLSGMAVLAPPSGAGPANLPWVVDTTADELNGPSTNGLTLREAVQESNEESGPSIIQLAPGAHYLLLIGCGVPGEEDDNVQGDLDVLNEPLTIDGNGATIEQGCGGENGERVIESTQDLTLEDVTVQGGDTPGDGGGILLDGTGADLTLLRSVVRGNAGATGGGLYVAGGLLLEDSSITGNTGGDAGGARVDRLATLTRSSITGNQATSTGGLHASTGGLVMTQSAVTGNQSQGGGGGIRASGTPFTISDSTVSGNTTDDVGGGVLAESAVTLTRSTLDDNRAENNGSNVHQLDGMTLTATVLSNGQPAANCNTTGGIVTSLGFNAESGSNSCGLTQPSDLLANVQLRPLFNNGGGTPTNYPSQTSPLVDGLPTANGSCNSEDQRTVARPQGGDCDIGAVEVAECGEIFADVTASNTFCWEIGWMDAAEVTTGFPDGFRPSGSVTRQAMAAFMYRLVGEPAFTPPPTATFPDVPTTSTFFSEIEWLNEFGITTGFPNGDFRPAGLVTRQAMSAFMYRLAGEPVFEAPLTPTFADVATTSTFYAEIEWMSSEGITTGFPGTGIDSGPGAEGDGPPTTTYRPAGLVTRQAMSAFMYRLAELPLISGLPD